MHNRQQTKRTFRAQEKVNKQTVQKRNLQDNFLLPDSEDKF